MFDVPAGAPDHEGARVRREPRFEPAVAPQAAGAQVAHAVLRAHLHLAEQALRDLRFWDARAHVDAYRAAPGEARYDVMADEIERRVLLIERGLWSGLGVLGLAVVAVPVVWLWRRRRGRTVQDLLDRGASIVEPDPRSETCLLPLPFFDKRQFPRPPAPSAPKTHPHDAPTPPAADTPPPAPRN